ncbi:hypothetical protein [Hungatella sp. SB206]|uniref:hypothetical protein n=1 Tax=Hungatella sp. SB206 TaxID=2937758 RepID=UPI003DA9E199
MTNLAQGGYTHEEVLKRLEGDRMIDFRFELLDRNERKLKDLDNVSGSIRFDSSQEIMGTGNFIVEETAGVDFKETDLRIRPVFMLLTEHGWLKYPLGIYIMSSPERQTQNCGIYQNIDCYDYSTILREDKIRERLFIASGSNYVREVRNLINGAGIKKINIETSVLMARENIEFEIGTSKLEVINALLTAINYEPLHFNGNGYAVSRRYVEPVNRRTEHSYRTDDKSLIKAGAKQSLDMYNVPNIFVRYTDDPDGEELRSEYVNDSVGSKISTVNRGRNVVDIESVDDIADQETLDALVRRIAIEKSQTYDTITIPTGLMPHHEYRDCIFVNETTLGVGNKYIEYAWEMELSVGGTMTHTLKRVVKL